RFASKIPLNPIGCGFEAKLIQDFHKSSITGCKYNEYFCYMHNIVAKNILTRIKNFIKLIFSMNL
ncbi:hypothetical protein, partial [Leyella stercorea]|uniref:hypothetical protein n=1 Tax=Leyella stercorea TaxID=363265 RepID=UPI002672A414